MFANSNVALEEWLETNAGQMHAPPFCGDHSVGKDFRNNPKCGFLAVDVQHRVGLVRGGLSHSPSAFFQRHHAQGKHAVGGIGVTRKWLEAFQ